MFNRGLKYALLSGAALLALGMSGASAQQTIAPASATPTAPLPEVLARYTGHRGASEEPRGRQLALISPHL
jgi:hypothetical protein